MRVLKQDDVCRRCRWIFSLDFPHARATVECPGVQAKPSQEHQTYHHLRVLAESARSRWDPWESVSHVERPSPNWVTLPPWTRAGSLGEYPIGTSYRLALDPHATSLQVAGNVHWDRLILVRQESGEIPGIRFWIRSNHHHCRIQAEGIFWILTASDLLERRAMFS